MKDHLNFLRGFLKNPFNVGSIAPSSPELAQKMVEGIEADERNAVLEIGCGTGAITKFIDRLIPDRKSFIGIEIEPDFVRNLSLQYPELTFVCGDACRMSEILLENGVGPVKYIVSGLPFVVLPPKVSEAILDEVDDLMKLGCTFRTFQYAHGYNLAPAKRFRLGMSEKYGEMTRSPLILKNFPPAYVLTWSTIPKM